MEDEFSFLRYFSQRVATPVCGTCVTILLLRYHVSLAWGRIVALINNSLQAIICFKTIVDKPSCFDLSLILCATIPLRAKRTLFGSKLGCIAGAAIKVPILFLRPPKGAACGARRRKSSLHRREILLAGFEIYRSGRPRHLRSSRNLEE